MISPAEAQRRANVELSGFPAPITEAYVDFTQSGDVALLRYFVLGIMQFYLARPPELPLTELPGNTRLVQDLGCDSLTIIDMLFLVERLLDIRLSDDELSRATTIDGMVELFHGRAALNSKASV
jgi:3-hydroxyacyl-[acyl-carrier-protein] dehydratase